jgi:curved DNA-binding protein CbpA
MSNPIEVVEPGRSRVRGREAEAEKISAYYLELQRLLDRIEHAATHYQALGLKLSATKEEMQLAYRQAVTLLHPSQYGIHPSLPDDMAARTKRAFDGVSLAFSVLTNLVKRIEYDNSLRSRVRVPLPIGISERVQETKPDAATETSEDEQSLHPPTDQEQDNEVIVINDLRVQGEIYSKPATGSKDEDRRRCPRFNLSIPAYVTIYDRGGGKAQEIAQVTNVGRFGIGIRLKKLVQPGRVLHVSLPMPLKLRNHGFADFRYGIYAIVRRVELPQNGTSLVERPPAGFLDRPWATFNIKRKERVERKREQREEQA